MAGENINRRLNIYINDREVVNSLSGITREMGKTRNELKNLNKNSEDYDKDLARLTKHLADLNERQGEFRDELKLTNKEMSAASDNFSNLLGGLATGDMKAVQEGLMGIRGSIVATTQAGWAFVATPIGAFIAGLVALGAGVKFLWDYNTGLTEMNNKLISLGTSSDSLSQVRSEIQATAETFDKEFNEIAEKANSLSKTYGISMSEANDIIAQGLANGGAQNSEFLDSLGEYDEFFAKAGYSAQQFVDVINTGYDLGIYSDKLPDALKEADLALKEQTKTTRDALINAFGAGFTDEILKKVRTGEMTTKEALDAIAVKSKETGLSQQQQAQLTADVFKGAGEDAGGAQKILDAVAASANKNMSESAKLTDDLRLANERLNEVQSNLFEVNGFSDAWIKVKTVGIDALSTFIEGFANFKTDIQPLIDLVGVVLYGAWESVKFVFLTSFDVISGAFQLFGNGVKNFVQFFTKLFEGDIIGAFKVVGNGILDMGKIVSNVFIGIKNNVLTTISNMIDIVSPMLNALGLDVDRIKKKLENWKSQKFEIKGTVKINEPNTPKGTPGRELSKDSGNIDANKEAADAAKKREKELADAKKHSEDLLKQENDLQKQLNESRAKAADLKFGLIKDDYDREKALVNAEYDKKIEDLELNIKKEQQAIDKLKAGIASPKTSQSDLISLKKQLKDRLEIQENYNATMLFTDQTRDLKLGALQEKFLQKELQEQEKQNANALLNLKTRHNNELASVKILEDAKSVLSKSLSVEELAKIKTLDQAKKELKKQQLKEEFDLQKSHLDAIVKKYNDLLNGQTVDGFKIMTNEQRDEIIQNLDLVKNKLSEVLLAGSGSEPAIGTREEGLKSLSSLDILGSSPDQWDAVFNNLGTAESKIQAVTAVVGGLQNAFGMYFQFLEAGDKRNLQKFEAGINRKKAALSDQLEKGFITQEVYTARNAKLDQELAKKKAEIDYKQAKRQKGMQAAQIVSSTALSIMGIWAQVPKFDFGISAGVLTGVVAALGAAQLGLVLAQPLPDKNGFYDGGFTGTGNPRGVAGDVHFGEYVVPNKVLSSGDPVIPHIMGYVEAKRQGKQPLSQDDTASANTSGSNSSSGSNEMDIAVVNALNRNSEVLEKLEEDGLTAFLVNDIKTAKKMRDKIKEVNKLETNAKL